MYQDPELITMFRRLAAEEFGRWTSRDPLSTSRERWRSFDEYLCFRDKLDEQLARPESPTLAA